LLKTELSNEPIRADFLSFFQLEGNIVHLEFQTQPESNFPLRMLDYWVRLYRTYNCPIQQIVLFLKPTNSPRVYLDQLQLPQTQHRYRVVRLWEENPEPLLAEPGLLPLAVLAKSNNSQQLLTQVSEALTAIENPQQRKELATGCYILGGLKFEEQQLIHQRSSAGSVALRRSTDDFIGEEIMEESVTYQAILQKGLEQGLERGLEQGLEQGSKREGLLLVKRLIHRRLGNLSAELEQRIDNLSLSKLEDLAEALLEFNRWEELTHWLDNKRA
jgi:predicted transposase/invertase (TIGR01784 family)